MKTLVVIVCYKVVDLTIDCLRTLDDEVRSMPSTRVVVCENGTGGDAARRLAEAIATGGWGDWCELQVIHPNRGFTGGNNHVIRGALASADPPRYVLLLNADTLVHPGALRTLVAFMDEHPTAGIAGSRLEARDGSVQVSAFRFYSPISEFDRGLRLGVVSRLLRRWSVCPPPAPETTQAQWVSGACMIIRRDVIDAIGPLDEGYFTYFDDVDYCWNARRAGWPVWYVPASRVVHLEGASTGISSARPAKGRRASYWYQARRRFYLKNYGPLRAALVDAAFIAGLSLFRLRQAVQRKPDDDPARFLRDTVRHSVFLAGFGLQDVPNPALVRPVQEPAP